MSTSTCIDHIYLSVNVNYTGALSIPAGSTDHNIVIIARKTKVPKGKPKIVFKRPYRNFSQDAYLKDIEKLCWTNILKQLTLMRL